MRPHVQIVILCQIISNLCAGSEYPEAAEHRIQQVLRTKEQQQLSETTINYDTAPRYLENLTAIDDGSTSSDFITKACDLFPNACSKMEALERRFFHAGKLLPFGVYARAVHFIHNSVCKRGRVVKCWTGKSLLSLQFGGQKAGSHSQIRVERIDVLHFRPRM